MTANQGRASGWIDQNQRAVPATASDSPTIAQVLGPNKLFLRYESGLNSRDVPRPPSAHPGQGRQSGEPDSTDRFITIHVAAEQGVTVYFEYGTVSGVYSGSTSPADFHDGIVKTTANGLAPNTRYYYRMRYRPIGSEAEFLAATEHSFHTQRSRSDTFSFAVQSDSHQGCDLFYGDEL